MCFLILQQRDIVWNSNYKEPEIQPAAASSNTDASTTCTIPPEQAIPPADPPKGPTSDAAPTPNKRPQTISFRVSWVSILDKVKPS